MENELKAHYEATNPTDTPENRAKLKKLQRAGLAEWQSKHNPTLGELFPGLKRSKK